MSSPEPTTAHPTIRVASPRETAAYLSRHRRATVARLLEPVAALSRRRGVSAAS